MCILLTLFVAFCLAFVFLCCCVYMYVSLFRHVDTHLAVTWDVVQQHVADRQTVGQQAGTHATAALLPACSRQTEHHNCCLWTARPQPPAIPIPFPKQKQTKQEQATTAFCILCWQLCLFLCVAAACAFAASMTPFLISLFCCCCFAFS